MTTLDLSHQRAVGDLLQAERSLRQKSEETIRAMREALLETAIRFDGERLESLRRSDPTVLDRWNAADWRAFFNAIPARSQGWGNVAVVDEQAQRKLQKQIAQLQAALEQAEQKIQEEKQKNAEAILELKKEPAPVAIAPIAKPDAPAVMTGIPKNATPPLSVIIGDAEAMLLKYPKNTPSAFKGVLSGGTRTGGDLARIFQRYWLILYLIGRWRLSAVMEIEQALGGVVHVSGGSGSMRRVVTDMEEAGVLVSNTLTLQTTPTTLKLCRLSAEGGKLYQALFASKPYEDDWSRIIRSRDGERFPEYTVAELNFTMQARKRGWVTQVVPEVKGAKNAPDACVMREGERWYVALELDEKDHASRWHSLSALNNGRLALCAASKKHRESLVERCKQDKLAGAATDLETLVTDRYKEVNSESPLWLEHWK